MLCDPSAVSTSGTAKCHVEACTRSGNGNSGRDISSLLSWLKSSRDIAQVRSIHESVIQNGLASNICVASSLIRMYAKCGSMPEAREVFEGLEHRDVVSWTALILGNAENKQGDAALGAFVQMLRSGCRPNARTFTAVFKACTVLAAEEPATEVDGKVVKVKSLERGMSAHSQAEAFVRDDPFLGSTLVEMYSKCRSMADAHRVFDIARNRDIVLWTALMVGYVENGQYEAALEVFLAIRTNGCVPNSRSFVAALKACSGLAAREEATEVDGKFVKVAALEKGMALHSLASRSCRSSRGDVFLANILIDMYSSCGSLEDARAVFSKMERHDVISWTALLSGYAQNGKGDIALELFAAGDCFPDVRTFVALLKACVDVASREDPVPVGGRLVKMLALEKGMAVHCQALNTSCKFDVFLENTLIDMYSNCGSVEDSKLVFARMQHRDIVSWNALMLGYAENSECEAALQMLSSMQVEGCKPNTRTFVAAIKACTGHALIEEAREVDGRPVKILSLEKGMAVHSECVKRHCNSDIFVSSSLIDMYAKCGSMTDASMVFYKMDRPGVVPWTSLLLGYVEIGKPGLALELFVTMVAENCQPNSQTFGAAFKACGLMAEEEEFTEAGGDKPVKQVALERAFALHSLAVTICSRESFVDNTALVDMYAKCGSTADARRVFYDLECWKNPSSWSALLVGCARNGELDQALELLKSSGGKDGRTLAAALKACSSVAAWQPGRRTHAQICRSGLENDPIVATCMVDFYSKVGSMLDAQLVFDSMLCKDLVAWTALIAGYGRRGDTASMFQSFHGLRDVGLRPDSFTFLSIISACSHAGLVELGKRCLNAMETKYDLAPGCEHYHGMIDLLGRANHLDEAVMVAKSMPFSASYVTWTTILSSCKKWKNDRVGKVAFEALVEIDERKETAYLLMASLYGSLGLLEEKARVLARRTKSTAGIGTAAMADG